ncbi:MAG: rRNA maturation RNase YbeY [Candidatus Omnitrophica bacterium]|nr:rRNA maturation RNase YbeY [Candidatus Omnitrophota bacterium]
MKIIIKNLQKKVPVHPEKIKKAILKVLLSERAPAFDEITVCFVNDLKIRELNKRFLGSDTATDVLAFKLEDAVDAGNPCADIVISTDTARRNAAIYKAPCSQELILYVIHGILHLLGYDDHTDSRAKAMQEKQEEYLKAVL